MTDVDGHRRDHHDVQVAGGDFATRVPIPSDGPGVTEDHCDLGDSLFY